MADRRLVYHSIFVDTGVLVLHRLVPYNVAGRRAHNDIEVGGAFRHLIHIMAKHMSFRKQYLRQGFVLHFRAVIKPLERAVYIRKNV